MRAKRGKHGSDVLRYYILPVVLFLVVLLISGAGACMDGTQNNADQTDCLTFTHGEPLMVMLENYGESKILISKEGNILVTKEINSTIEGQGRVLLETDDWPDGEYNCTIYDLVSIDDSNSDFGYLYREESVGHSFLMGRSNETVEFTNSMYDNNWAVIEVTVRTSKPLYDLEVQVLDSRSPDANNWTYDLDMEKSKGYQGWGWFAEGPGTSFKFNRIINYDVNVLQETIRGAGWALEKSIHVNVVPEDLTYMKFEQKNNGLYLIGEGDRVLWKWNVGDNIDEVPVSANTNYLTTGEQGYSFTVSSKVFNNLRSATIEAANGEMAKGYNMSHPLEILTQSDQAFQDGSYQESLDLLLKARDLVAAPGLDPIAYSNAQTALVDAGRAITTGRSGGFDMARAEVSFAEAQQHFDDADYTTALSLAQEATQQATDVDGDGVPNEIDFAPTINNNLIYGGGAVVVAMVMGASLLAIRRYSNRRRREEKEIEAQKTEIISMIEKAIGSEDLHKPEKKH